MDLFKLVGKLAIDNTEANRNIDSVAKETEKIGKGFTSSEKVVGRSLKEIAAANGKTINEIRSEASKIASEYRLQGMSASEAMKKAYSDIGYVSKDTSDKMKNDASGAANAISTSFEKFGSIAKGIGVAGLAIGGSILAVTEGTREYRKEMGLLESSFLTAGHSSETAKKTYSELNAVLGDSGQAVEASQHLAKITDSEKELETWTNICTGVYSEFGQAIPLESLTESALEVQKNGQLTGGLVDALVWAGINEDEFQAKLDACTTEQERQDLIMNTLNDTYSKAADQYKETNKDVMEAEKAQQKLSDAFAEVGKVFEPIVTSIKNKVAEMVETAAPKIQELIDKIKDASNWVKDNEDKINAWVGVILGATVAVGTFLLILNWGTIMTAAASAINKVRTAILLMNAAMYANPVGIVIAVIAGLVAAFIYLWNTCEPFRQFWIDLWEKIKNATSKAVEAVKKWWKNMSDDMKEKFTSMKQKATEIFENIKSTISSKVQAAKDLASAAFTKLKANIISPITEAKNKVVEVFGNIYSTMKEKIESARDVVDSAIKKIKGFFPLSIGKIFSNLKIPSITVSGGKAPYGIAGKGTLPSFDVKWNAQGGIFDKPTVLPTLKGWQGFGESGAEAIIPLERNTEWIGKVADEFQRRSHPSIDNDAMMIRLNKIIELLEQLLGMKLYLDSGVLVGELAPSMNRKLGELYTYEARGNTR